MIKTRLLFFIACICISGCSKPDISFITKEEIAEYAGWDYTIPDAEDYWSKSYSAAFDFLEYGLRFDDKVEELKQRKPSVFEEINQMAPSVISERYNEIIEIAKSEDYHSSIKLFEVVYLLHGSDSLKGITGISTKDLVRLRYDKISPAECKLLLQEFPHTELDINEMIANLAWQNNSQSLDFMLTQIHRPDPAIRHQLVNSLVFFDRIDLLRKYYNDSEYIYDLLFYALQYDRVTVFDLPVLANYTVPLAGRDEKINYAFFRGIHYGSYHAVDRLINCGIDLNLHSADARFEDLPDSLEACNGSAGTRNLPIVVLLISRGAKATKGYLDYCFRLALFKSSSMKYLEYFRGLGAAAEVLYGNDYGDTLLHALAKYKFPIGELSEKIMLLQKMGFPLKQKNSEGKHFWDYLDPSDVKQLRTEGIAI